MTRKSRALKFLLTLIFVPLIYQFLIFVLRHILDEVGHDGGHGSKLFWVLINVALLHLVFSPWLRLVYNQSYAQWFQGRQGPKAAFMAAQIFALALLLFSEPIFLLLNWSGLSFHWQEDWTRWLLWFLPLLIAIFLQTSAEEVVFRGYLQSELGYFFASKWIAILVPALIWASIHQAMFDDPAFKLAVVAQMFVLGVIFGIWSDKTGTIWGPVFVHFIINAFTMLIYGNSLRPTEFYILQTDVSALSHTAQLSYFFWGAFGAILAYIMLTKHGKNDDLK